MGDFLKQVDTWFREQLNPGLELAGIVSTMTVTNPVPNPNRELTPFETDMRQLLNEAAMEFWGKGDHLLTSSVPDTARFREDVGQTIAFLDERQANQVTRQIVTILVF